MRIMLDTNILVMRNPKDIPVLAQAIAGKVDVLVTGDKDFQGLGIDTPIIITPTQYVSWYMRT